MAAIQTSIILAFAAMVFWGFGDFFIQKSLRKIGDLESLAYIGVIGIVLLLPFIISDLRHLSSLSNVILLVGLGLVTFVAAMCDFEALKKGKLSVIDVIFEIELPITIIFGMVFFRESLTAFQAMVISTIFIGIILISTKSFSHWKSMVEKGVAIGAVGALLMGIVNFLTASSAKQISPLMAIWVPWVVFTIISVAVIIQKGNLGKFVSDGRRFWWAVAAMGILDTMAWLSYAGAVAGMEISIITAITESYPAIAMLLGVHFNKEKIVYHQYFGAILALAASFMLCLTI